MKKCIIQFVFLLCASPLSFAQVSINTNNPNGVFYIDGGADNATAGANRFKNDVMVDANGSLVLGQPTAPVTGKAKVDITSDAPYGALRMSDGGEGNGMVMLGDADGYARWGMLKGSGGYRLSVTGPGATMAAGTYYFPSFSNGLNYIPIRESGSYIVMIRMTALYWGVPTRTGGYFNLHKNSTAAPAEDTIEMYFDCIHGQYFSTYAVLCAQNLVAGDQLYWGILPQVPGSQWTVNLSLTTVFFYRV